MRISILHDVALCVATLLFVIFTFAGADEIVDGTKQIKLRSKRQVQDPGNQIIDNIFKIPITTLTAVSDLIKSTRPVVREVRRRAQEQYNQYQDNRRRTSTTYEYIDLRKTTPRTYYNNNRRNSHAASVAGVYQQYDGSRYRI